MKPVIIIAIVIITSSIILVAIQAVDSQQKEMKLMKFMKLKECTNILTSFDVAVLNPNVREKNEKMLDAHDVCMAEYKKRWP